MADSDWVMLALAILFVVTAAFLVAAETAIGRVSRSRVDEMAREKPGKATDRLRLIVEDRARYVNVMLFLHTAFSVAATALVTYLCVETGTWGPLVGLFLALLIMTGVMFIALGVAPRTLGRQHADRIALRWGKFARGAAAALGPFVSLLILIGNALTPGRGYREGPFASQAELRELVDQAEADRVIEDDEAAMLHSVFELGDTIVREVMVPRTEMVWIERHKTLRQALSLALRSGYSRIPVIGDGPDDVVGVFYLKDVVNRVFEHRESEATERIDSTHARGRVRAGLQAGRRPAARPAVPAGAHGDRRRRVRRHRGPGHDRGCPGGDRRRDHRRVRPRAPGDREARRRWLPPQRPAARGGRRASSWASTSTPTPRAWTPSPG